MQEIIAQKRLPLRQPLLRFVMPIMARLSENDKANKELIGLIIIERYANGRYLKEDLRS